MVVLTCSDPVARIALDRGFERGRRETREPANSSNQQRSRHDSPHCTPGRCAQHAIACRIGPGAARIHHDFRGDALTIPARIRTMRALMANTKSAEKRAREAIE